MASEVSRQPVAHRALQVLRPLPAPGRDKDGALAFGAGGDNDALLLVEKIDLVPDLQDRGRVLERCRIPLLRRGDDAKRRKHLQHVLALRLAVGMGDIPHMEDQVSGNDFLKRGPEGGDKLCGQIGHETHRVREDRLVETRKVDRSHRRVERSEQHVPAPPRPRPSAG